MHKVSSLPKNNLICFDTTKRDNTIHDKQNVEYLLELINHNIVLINGKTDSDKLIDFVCEKFQDINLRFNTGYLNIIYISTNLLNDPQLNFEIRYIL